MIRNSEFHNIPNVEDSIFSKCVTTFDGFLEYITNYDDIEEIMPERLLTKSLKNLNLDTVRLRSNGSILNVEHHSGLSPGLMRRNHSYAVELHREFGKHVKQIIYYTGRYPATETDFLNDKSVYAPEFKYTQLINAEPRLNNIKYKVENSQELKEDELLDMIWMVRFNTDIPLDDLILELAEIWEKLKTKEKYRECIKTCLTLWAGMFIKQNDKEKIKILKRRLKMTPPEEKEFLNEIRAARIQGELMRAEEKGFQDGEEKGFKNGKEKGFQDGEKIGLKNGKNIFIKELIIQHGINKVAEFTNYDIETLQEIKNNGYATK